MFEKLIQRFRKLEDTTVLKSHKPHTSQRHRFDKLAEANGYMRVEMKNNTVLRYVRDDEIIDVWPTKMTVSTIVNHPKKGRTPLYRKHVSVKELEKIFKKPRLHSGHGYYKK